LLGKLRPTVYLLRWHRWARRWSSRSRRSAPGPSNIWTRSCGCDGGTTKGRRRLGRG